MEIMTRMWDAGIETLFPRFCLRCTQEGTAWCQLCDEVYTLRTADPVCPFCGKEGSDQTCSDCAPEVFLDGLSALTYYADPLVRRAITTWKYSSDAAYGNVVLRWIQKGAHQYAVPFEPFVLTHIPLHVFRRRQRDFDQAEEIAKTVAEALGLEHVSLLKRCIATRSQATRAHESRLIGDLDGVFQIVGPVPRNVLLCDDVFTSGVTMDAAAKALKDAGAKLVWGVVVARGKAS